MLIEWEYHAPDTWAGEQGEHLFIIKSLASDQYYYVFGTSEEVMVTGDAGTLSDAQAIANRWGWIVNNVTPERVGKLLFKM